MMFEFRGFCFRSFNDWKIRFISLRLESENWDLGASLVKLLLQIIGIKSECNELNNLRLTDSGDPRAGEMDTF